MAKKIVAVCMIVAVFFSCAVPETVQAAGNETEGKTIVKMEVVDTASQISYKSVFTKENIVLQITYSDNSVELVHPDEEISVNTSCLGKQTLEIFYQKQSIHYTIEVVPRQVTGLGVKNIEKTSAVITWGEISEATGYEIYTSSKEKGTYTLIKSVTKTTHEFLNLTRGKILYVKIRATSGEMAGAYSSVIAVAPKPDAVSNIRSVQNTKTKITLEWDKAEGATGYVIYYRQDTDKDFVLAGSTTELSYPITSLSAGKNYYCKIYAFAGTQDNRSDDSETVLCGTAPSIPVISKIKGGDKRVKVYWKKGSGATSFTIYYSTKSTSGFKTGAVVGSEESKVRGIDGLKKNKKYYVKIEASRTVSGITMKSVSTVKSAKTAKKAAKSTSTTAKYYTTKKAFKKSKAYKKYSAFRKNIVYKASVVIPGLKVTNVAGFNATRMVPQSVAFAGNYMLISAYAYGKAQESVIYIMNKNTKKYITTLVLPHTGHVGGMAFDGVNVWITYGKNLQAFKFSEIEAAVASGKAYYELYRITAICPMPETVSYVAYYKDRIWAGAYNELSKKYMYAYAIGNKYGTPTLTNTNRMLMPNRTQGVAFTDSGKMIISRSCQTKKGRRGFMSRLDTYKPTWNLQQNVIKKNKKKKTVQMPPMNEGIAVLGSKTYVIYESAAFSECQAPIDRVTAFKTSKIS